MQYAQLSAHELTVVQLRGKKHNQHCGDYKNKILKILTPKTAKKRSTQVNKITN